MSLQRVPLLRRGGHDAVGPVEGRRVRRRQRSPASNDEWVADDEHGVAENDAEDYTTHWAKLLRKRVLDPGFEEPSAFTNVTIKVGPDAEGKFVTFYANSLVLSLKSRKFERQFHGPLKEFDISVGEPVDAFRKILTYIYKDEEVRLPSVETETEDFIELWELSDLYEINSLETFLVNSAIAAVTKDNVLTIWQIIERYLLPPSADRVRFKCLQVLDKCAVDILASHVFIKLGQDLAVDVVKRKSLAASEKQVFDAALCWCRAEFQRHLDSLSPGQVPSLAQLFSPFKPYINFEEFSSHEFVHDVMGAEILDAGSMREIAENICQLENRRILWSSPTRTRLRAHQSLGDSYPPDILSNNANIQYYQATRYEPEEDMVSSSAWPRQYVVEFCCDKSVFIVGACITETDEANYSPRVSFDVTLNVPPGGDVVAHGKHQQPYGVPSRLRLGHPKSLECGPNVVIFNKAVVANENVWHRLTVTFSESAVRLPLLLCRCKDVVEAAGVKFRFRRVGENFTGLRSAPFSPFELITRLLFYY